jgi:CBS domain-containing protein
MVISSQTTVEEAMDTLLLSSQNVVAVVDENGRVINDLHIDDLLAYALRESQDTLHV